MLTSDEKLKYSRQIMLNKFGEQGQIALQNAKVLIVGIGGLGNPAAHYIAASGIGTLYLADGDNIELSNLPRQTLFSEANIGENKAHAAQEKLQAQYPEVEIEVIDEMLDDELASYYISQVDIVLDCTDNISARYLLNGVCTQLKVPLVIGAATGFDGQCLFVDTNQESSACYQCLFPASEKAPVQNCQTLGILSPVLAIIAGMQALQALKYLVGIEVKTNQLSMFDGLSAHWQEFTLPKNEACLVCGIK
ncbi:MAG: HesA/MoeB/ThiF family protein [Thalassotalea sp.]